MKTVVGVAVALVAAVGGWFLLRKPAAPCVAESRAEDAARLLGCLFPTGSAFSTETPAFVALESLPLGEPPPLPNEKVASAKVVAQRNVKGKDFAVIAFALESQCHRTRTETWVRQEGGWRRLLIPESLVVGTEESVVQRVTAWRKIDPFSIPAIDVFAALLHDPATRQLRFGMLERAGALPDFDMHHLAEAVRAVNPEDDLVAVLRLVEAENDEALLAGFAALPRQSCAIPFANELLLSSLAGSDALVAAGAKSPDEFAGIVISRVLGSDRPATVLTYLTPAREQVFLSEAQLVGNVRRAEVFAGLGIVLARAGQKARAQEYLELARGADANSIEAVALAEILEGKSAAEVLGGLCGELQVAMCGFKAEPEDTATIAMGWLGQRLRGHHELVSALAVTGMADPSVGKRMFREIMSDAAGKPWSCAALEAMWAATWLREKECPTAK